MGRDYLIRSYAGADRAGLELMYDGFEPKDAAQGLPPGRERERRRWLERTLATGVHLVVEEAGELIGHAMLIPSGDGEAELANFVHQAARGRGVGTELNRAALDAARLAGMRRVWLTVSPVNRAAIRSYERAGFRTRPETLALPEVEMEALTSPDPPRPRGPGQ